jgi:hypothetical protein
MKNIITTVLAILIALLAGCGGGGGGGASAVPSNFAGTWIGSSGGSSINFVIQQAGNSLVVTKNNPTAGITYDGVVNGSTALINVRLNNVTFSTLTFVFSNNTTIIATVTSCNPPAGYSCATAGTAIALSLYSPVTSAISFPLQSGMASLTANGYSKSFTISGTCSGSGSRTNGPASTATTFEGQTALSAVDTISYTFSNCTPASTAQTLTAYYNSSTYIPLGFNSVGVNYGVYLTPPAGPATVSVGDTGIIGTETLWTNSAKTTPNGRSDLSYIVSADTATTAIVTLIAKIYNSSSVLTATEQDNWRITSTGTLTPISVDIQYANGSTTHLVWTYN